jgi:hypothetical protein|tara:strand:- start:1097 stop:1321 length:225 start_codon:yes stop_codon:yes gene_type:complete
MIRTKQPKSEIIIDLTGPQGNAFNLIALASNFGKQLGMSNSYIKEIQANMMSGDYENLIKVFDAEFGSVVILER